MTSPLKYLSEAKLSELRGAIPANIARYNWGDFSDLAGENGWEVESRDVQVDSDILAHLDEGLGTPARDADASIIVYSALKGLTPAMAAEERVWVRLTHMECLPYCRARWIEGAADETLTGAIRTHMFAAGVQGIRDDNALSRLWWNMRIATIADPDDPEGALRLILRSTDTRMQFVERFGTASRAPIARAVVRGLRRHDWLHSEKPFRAFMKALNREGGGVMFEILNDEETDRHVDRCVSLAQAHAEAS